MSIQLTELSAALETVLREVFFAGMLVGLAVGCFAVAGLIYFVGRQTRKDQ